MERRYHALRLGGLAVYDEFVPPAPAGRAVKAGLRRRPRGAGGGVLRPSGRPKAAAAASGHLDIVVLERERADALPGRLEEGIEHGRRGDADRRLADATPEAARWHHDRLDLRHPGDTHHVVAVEVLLLDVAVLDRALAQEQSGETIHKRARDLPLDLSWVDCVSRVGSGDNAVNLDLVAVDRDFGARGHITTEGHSLR